MENENRGEIKEINPALKAQTSGFAFSLSTAAYLVVSLVAGLIISAAKLEQGSDAYIYINYIFAQFAVLSGALITVKYKKLNVRETFPLKCNPKYFLIALLIIFGLVFSLGHLNEYALKLVKLINPNYVERTGYLPDLSGGLIVPALLVIAVLPAICEEALFRGVILNSCERGMGTVRTVFVVGFCFSLFHGSPEQTVYQFIAGCAFAFVAIRAGSILPTVLMHFINNAIIVIFAACGLLDAGGNLAVSYEADIALAVVGAACFIGGVIWLILDKKPVIKCEKGAVKNFFLFASLGILVFAVLWVCSFAGVGA